MTWLNDGPVKEAVLKHGDCLTLGPVQLRFVITVGPPSERLNPLPPRSESVFDDEDDTPAADESRIQRASDTVIDLPHPVVDPSQENVYQTAHAVLASPDAASNLDRDESTVAAVVEPPPVETTGLDIVETAVEAPAGADELAEERALLSERRRLLDEREAELRELFASVNARHSQLLQQQQQLDVLLRRATVVPDPQRDEQASRLVAAERQLVEQEQSLASLRDELRSRVAAAIEAGRHAASLQLKLDRQAAAFEDLQRRESLLQRGTRELDALSRALDEDTRRITVEREACLKFERETSARAADIESKAAELESARQALESARQLVESDRQWLNSEKDKLGQQRSVLNAHAAELSERDYALSQAEDSLRTDREAANQRDRDLTEREQILRARQQELTERENQLKQLQETLAERSRAADERNLEWESLRSALADERVELDRARSQFEADRQAWQHDVRRQQESLHQLRDQMESDRKRYESEIADFHRRLADRERDLNFHEEELSQLRQECQRLSAELVAREAAVIAEPAPHSTDVAEQQPELEDWRERLALLEQELNERARQLDQREQQFEEQRLAIESRAASDISDPSCAWASEYSDYPGGSSNDLACADHRASELIEKDMSNPSDMSSTTEVGLLTAEDDPEASHSTFQRSSEPAKLEEPDVQTLRHQLAEMFGIQASAPCEEPAVARQEAEESVSEIDEPADDSAAVAAEATVKERSVHGTAHNESHDHDTVESYWQRLLARNRSDRQCDTQPIQAEQERQPVASDVAHVEKTDHKTDHESLQTNPVIVAIRPDAIRRTPSLDQEERSALRAHMSSLRAVANQSARSAVAKHFTKQMTLQYHVKGLITLVCGVVCIVMLTSPFWSNVNYVVQGIATFIITGLMGTLLWFDYRKMQAAAEAAMGGGRAEEDLDEASPDRRTDDTPASQDPSSTPGSPDEIVDEADSASLAAQGELSSMLSGLFARQAKE